MNIWKNLIWFLEQFHTDYEIVEEVSFVARGRKAETERKICILAANTEDGYIALYRKEEMFPPAWEEWRKQLGYEFFEPADSEDIKIKTGFSTEELPAVGHGLPCIFSRDIPEKGFVYGPSGFPGYLLKIRVADLIQLNHIIAWL